MKLVQLVNEMNYMIYAVLAAVIMRLVFLDVMQYSLVALYWHFRETCCLCQWHSWQQIQLEFWILSVSCMASYPKSLQYEAKARAFGMLHHVKKSLFKILFVLYSIQQQLLQWVWTRMETSDSIIKLRLSRLVYWQGYRFVFRRCLIQCFWGVKQWPVCRADNLTAICEPIV
jgi:hypothetical protein